MKGVKFYLAVILITCLTILSGQVWAENIELQLPSNDGSDAFQVKDSLGIIKMHVQSDGNVGIGTTNPDTILTLSNEGETKINLYSISNGAGHASKLTGISSRGSISTPLNTLIDDKLLVISGRGYGNTAYSLRGVAAIIFHAAENWTDTAQGADIRFNTTSLGGTPLPDRAERMRITADGNVGIGTTTPQGKLDVNGTIYQRGGQIHADYVFEPDYRMESIEEHADFMFKERHLSAVPKATKDENGLDIVEYGSHMKGMLEELEKAHVYITKLNTMIKEQQKVITDLSDKVEKLGK